MAGTARRLLGDRRPMLVRTGALVAVASLTTAAVAVGATLTLQSPTTTPRPGAFDGLPSSVALEPPPTRAAAADGSHRTGWRVAAPFAPFIARTSLRPAVDLTSLDVPAGGPVSGGTSGAAQVEEQADVLGLRLVASAARGGGERGDGPQQLSGTPAAEGPDALPAAPPVPVVAEARGPKAQPRVGSPALYTALPQPPTVQAAEVPAATPAAQRQAPEVGGPKARAAPKARAPQAQAPKARAPQARAPKAQAPKARAAKPTPAKPTPANPHPAEPQPAEPQPAKAGAPHGAPAGPSVDAPGKAGPPAGTAARPGAGDLGAEAHDQAHDKAPDKAPDKAHDKAHVEAPEHAPGGQRHGPGAPAGKGGGKGASKGASKG